MKRLLTTAVRFFTSILLFCIGLLSMQANGIIKESSNLWILMDDSLHLYFALNPQTMTAMVGNGIDREHTAIYMPPADDSWWNTQENLWEEINVPSTVTWDSKIYTVTGVAQRAFYRQTGVRKIVLPETISMLGTDAFNFCVNLESINIPDEVEEIPSYMFYGDWSLRTIKLPQKLKSIGRSAFSGCKSLASISIPGNCTSIEQDAFSWCLSLNKLSFEDGESEIFLSGAYEFGPLWESGSEVKPNYPYYERTWRGMFNDCTLEDIYIGRNIVITDELYANYSPFEFMSQNGYGGKIVRLTRSVKNVEFGDKVRIIPNNLFLGVKFQNSVNLPPMVEYIGAHAFDKSFEQPKLVVPASCKTIGEDAILGSFYEVECKSPEPPTLLGWNFNSNITLVVPEGKRNDYHKDNTWSQYFMCDSADSTVEVDVKYPGSLYGRLAFQDLSPTDVYKLKVSGTLNDDDISVISEMENLYELNLSNLVLKDIAPLKRISTKLRHIEFPQGIEEIPDGFFGSSKLSGRVIIPNSCKRIGKNAFWDSPITELVINGSTTIDERAFGFCAALSKASISGEETVIKNNAFYCTSYINKPESGLRTLVLGDGVVVESGAVNSCYGLNKIIIEGDVESIESEAFDFCESLSSITFNGRVRKFDVNAFSKYCSKIDTVNINNIGAWVSMTHNVDFGTHNIFVNGIKPFEITIPNGISSISAESFKSWGDLEYVTLPDGIMEIGDNAFRDCSQLKSINMPNRLTYIGEGVFSGCENLGKINIPETVKHIANSSFNGCLSLKDVYLPKQLETIGDNAFDGCRSIENMTMPQTVVSIGTQAFKNCSGINSIDLPCCLTEIGELAFENCDKLNTITSKQVHPIEIPTNAFNNISKKCILWVPIGSVGEYYNNGWGRIPLIDEKNYVVRVKYNKGGKIVCDGKEISSGGAFWISPEGNVDLFICPDSNYYAKSCVVGDSTKILGLREYTYQCHNEGENQNVEFVFKKYVKGDANDDDFIDVGDITSIVQSIKEESLVDFIPIAADVNEDNSIDVGDIRGIVNIIYGYNAALTPTSRAKRRFTNSNFAIEYDSITSSNTNYEKVLSFGIVSDYNFVGFQTEIVIPKGFHVPVNSYGLPMIEVAKEHQDKMNIVSVTQKRNGNYLLICSSDNFEKEFESTSHNLFTVKLTVDDPGNVKDSEMQLELKEMKIVFPDASVATQNYAVQISMWNHNTSGIPHLGTMLRTNTRKVLYRGKVVVIANDKIYDLDGKIDYIIK